MWLRRHDRRPAQNQSGVPETSRPSASFAPPNRPSVERWRPTSYEPPAPPAVNRPSVEHWRRHVDSSPPARAPTRVARRKARPQAEIGPNSTLAFIDTETTGTSREDRIITLAIATMQASALQEGKIKLRTMHLVFNPLRPCHPQASAIHGWSDRTLARQPRFADHADEIADRLASADVWLMHNAAFDCRLLEQDFDALSRTLPTRPTFCTLRAARQKWPQQSNKLDYCVERIGLARAGNTHGALEDALLTAALFSFLHTGKRWKRLPEAHAPTNLVH